MSVPHARGMRPIQKIAVYAVLLLGSVVLLMPFVWMLFSSLKPADEVFSLTSRWFPTELRWSNYYEAMTILPFHRYIWNSIVLTSGVIIGNVISCSFVAFGFTFFRFPFRNTLFIVLLSTMMLPAQVTMIPVFKIFAMLGWVDTYKPFIVPAFCGTPFFVFLFRQFYRTLPRDLFDAAKIDGLSSFGIYWRISLPLTKPVIATVAIFSFMGTWNDFMGPLIYISSEDKFPMALGLASFRGQYFAEWNLLMAASIIALLPCVVLFFIGQRYFVRGIVTTGIKG